MKKTIIALLLGLSMMASPVMATDVWRVDEHHGEWMTVYCDTDRHTFVGESRMNVDGTDWLTYCIDLLHPLPQDHELYLADVYPAPQNSQHCELSYILTNYEATNNFTGSSIQLALWKIIYGKDEVYVNDTPINSQANSIYDDAKGKCVMDCNETLDVVFSHEDNENLVFKATVSPSIHGEPIEFTTTCGTINLSDDETNGNGEAFATINPGECTSLTVTATATNKWIKIIRDPQGDIQLSINGDITCEKEDSATFTYEEGSPVEDCEGGSSVCGDYSITFVSKETVNGDWNWTYEVCQYGDKDISHWVLGSCICSAYGSLAACEAAGVISDYGSSLGTVTLEYGDNSQHTGIRGFKFEGWPDESFECATFWIVTRILDEEPQDVGLKTGEVEGDILVCTDYPQVKGPAHETTTVPEFSSLAVALAILLTTPAFAYLIIKKKH